MADVSITTAMAVAGASTEKTNLVTYLTSVQTGITAACTANRLSTLVRDKFNNDVMQLAERIAKELA